MPRNSEQAGGLAAAGRWLKRRVPGGRRDPLGWLRVGLGLLLAANLAAALAVFKPWGGSGKDLERELIALRQDVAQRRETVARLREVVAKVESARQQTDRFVADYFLDRRTVSSTVLSELEGLAKQAGIKLKEGSYLFEPVEGSEGLSMMTINLGSEGAYGDLMHFLNLLDRCPRLLIVSDLQAAPQTSGLTLNVTMKLNAFVREQTAGSGSAATRAHVEVPGT